VSTIDNNTNRYADEIAPVALIAHPWRTSKRFRGSTMSKISILSEFWSFLKTRKKWWLAPIIIFLILLGALIILTEGSAIAPFIYALF
jgi:hypothetical protein